MSVWSKIAKIAAVAAPVIAAPFTGGASLTALPAVLQGVGAAASSASQAMANNRGNEINAAIEQQKLRDKERTDYEDAIIKRQQQDMASGEDAMRKLQQTEYLLNKKDYVAPTFTSGVAGKSYTSPDFGFGPKAASDYERWGATNMRDEVMKRLLNVDRPDNPYAQQPIAPQTQFTIDPKLLKGSIWEKILGFGGAGATAYGAARSGIGSPRINSDSSINT